MASPDYPDAQFEWDEAKAIANLEKHGVSFREAREIFDDEFMQLMYDDDHSDAEERFIAIGMSKTWKLLIVVHTIRNDRFRLISARNATNSERRSYENGIEP
jgi:uncharacterized protein